MRIQIWADTPKAPEAKPLNLRLRQEGDMVTVYAVNEYGNPIPSGNILGISAQGVNRCGAVNRSLGLPLDGSGRVQEIN